MLCTVVIIGLLEDDVAGKIKSSAENRLSFESGDCVEGYGVEG